jgi:crotonobetaine/carnitine-CoA ligase
MDYLNRIPISESMTHRLLERRAAEAPDAVFFTLHNETYSLGRVNATSNRLARNLQDAGIVKGTHVAVIMETSADYICLWMALSKIGAVEVPINTAYRGDLLTHVLRTCQATVCIFDARFAGVVEGAAPGLEVFDQVFVRAEAGAALPARTKNFSTLLAPNDEANPDVAQRHQDLTGIIFTSGTTGPSKGVMLSHRYLTAYGLMYAEINGLRDDDVVMNFLPFFHIGAKFLTIATLACGGRMLLQPRLSISTFWQEVRAHGVTNFIGVGGICNMLISRPRSDDDANTTIRTIYAVPDPADIHDELERRFGCRMTTVYGSTEVGLPLFRGINDPYRPTACGRPSPYYDVQIVDADDNPVPVGVSGEIVVRPKLPFLVGSGYIGMPEQTVKAWRNLWLHTGDRGHADEDGWYYFDDRANDSIRRRGENISSFEVELLVAKHPAVAEAVAVATSSEIGEDEVWVLVILREGHSVRYEELLQHCSRHMPYFMVPRFIDIVKDVPRTSTAKVEKYKIRAAGPGATTWDREKHGWKVTREGLFGTDGIAVVSFASSPM